MPKYKVLLNIYPPEDQWFIEAGDRAEAAVLAVEAAHEDLCVLVKKVEEVDGDTTSS